MLKYKYNFKEMSWMDTVQQLLFHYEFKPLLRVAGLREMSCPLPPLFSFEIISA